MYYSKYYYSDGRYYCGCNVVVVVSQFMLTMDIMPANNQIDFKYYSITFDR